MDLKEVSIEVTNECSQKCIHCSSDTGTKFNDELSLDEIIDIIGQAKTLGAETLTLSGGEPILRGDILEIIAYGRQNNLEIRLLTSGVYNFGGGFEAMPVKFLEKFVVGSSQKDKIFYNLSGLKSTHERITTIQNSFDLVSESINRTKNAGLYVGVHTVVSSLNYQEIPMLADMLKLVGANCWHLLRLVSQGRATLHPELELNKEQFRELQEIFLIVCKENTEMEIILGHNIDKRYWSDKLNQISRCILGEDKILIGANGNVSYCAALKHINFGNIRENTLEYFWIKHPKIKEFRAFLNSGYRTIVNKCNNCELLTKCRGGCVAQRLNKYSNLFQGPDPLCYRTDEN